MKKLTLQTISESLKLSKTTVSLVLKGDGDKYRISKKTQGRVLNYAAEVGFEPDFLAKALATKKTSTIGLVFPDVHEAFMSEMVRGIETVLYKAGYSIMLSTSGFNSEFELRNIRQLVHRKVDGIIIAPYIPISDRNFNHAYLNELNKAECPVIFVDRIPPDNKHLSWIIQDDYNAACNAVNLLHSKGCKKIGCLSFNLNISSINNRIRGYQDGIKSFYPEDDADDIILLENQDPESNDLYLKLKEMSESKDPFDGMIITTGGIADKTQWLLKNTDLKLNNIPIVKFGKDPDYFKSGMIQIIQPNTKMGEIAAETVLNYISAPSDKAAQLEIKSILKEG